MNDIKILYAVLTCDKYISSRAIAIKETWGHDKDIVFLGDTGSVKKGVENAWEKYVNFLKTDLDENIFDYVFFTDDDTFVNIKNINMFLGKRDPTKSVCFGCKGVINRNATDISGIYTGFNISTIKGLSTKLPLWYLGGGAGFICSRESIKIMKEYLYSFSNNESIPHCCCVDISIGFWMRNAGIRIENVKGFWWTNPSVLNHSKSQKQESFTYHYIDPVTMRLLHYELNINKKSGYFGE